MALLFKCRHWVYEVQNITVLSLHSTLYFLSILLFISYFISVLPYIVHWFSTRPIAHGEGQNGASIVCINTKVSFQVQRCQKLQSRKCLLFCEYLDFCAGLILLLVQDLYQVDQIKLTTKYFLLVKIIFTLLRLSVKKANSVSVILLCLLKTNKIIPVQL